MDVLGMFPELFGFAYTFAVYKGWNSETPLIEMFGTLFSRVEKPPSKQKHLRVPIQESEPISTEQATK